ncbi:hypothetical protein [Sulfurimonas sp. HSL3-2]|uniref:hypothetical protein n=1 Tax=Hydrocurvibacter mobilis TaxID=3131936 RepID=UPI0031F84189
MKSLFYFLAVSLFFAGCSYKNEAIRLKPYESDYAGALSKEKKSVYIRIVKDIRADKRDIGFTEANGKKDVTLYSDVDFADRYKEGLVRALKMAHFETDGDPQKASLTIDVHIKKITVIYNNKTFDENLVGEIDVEVMIRKNAAVTILNFKERNGKWISPSYDSKDIEPFLYAMFSNSINDIVSKLTNY